MNTTTSRRIISGYQKDVFNLYRSAFKLIRQKPKEYQPAWKALLKLEVEKNQALLSSTKMNPDMAEWVLRQSKKKIELYSNPTIVSVHLPNTNLNATSRSKNKTDSMLSNTFNLKKE